MENKPKVAVIYLSYHAEGYLDDLISALRRCTYPKDKLALVVVDNPHPELGPSLRALEEQILPFKGEIAGEVVILPQDKNLGFAAGNNAGMRWALANGYDMVYLHNQDGFMATDCLEKAVDAIVADTAIGAVQSLILLYPETDLVNTAGNSWHYLGFGYCGDFRRPQGELRLPVVSDIGYASGAGVLLRAECLRALGLWDEDYFLYHEDLEYSLRLKLAGRRVVVSSASIFYHRYQFNRNAEKYFWMERNRLGLMLSYFKWPTLLVLLPLELAAEIGLLFFALKNGWIKEWARAREYWLKDDNWRRWLNKRENIQRRRTISDRELLRSSVDTIVFDHDDFSGPVIKYVVNPVLNVLGKVIKALIVW